MIERIRKTNRNGKILLIFIVVFAISMALADDSTMFYNIIGIIWLNALILGKKMRLDISDALFVLATLTDRIINNPDPDYVIFGTINRFVFFQLVKSFADPCDADGDVSE
ncbi:MAG: hypothetical protein IKQ40_07015 [Lachnospiraceae bacterium]|nr:hypothetical protein [Lachnospiraceae bacterium]